MILYLHIKTPWHSCGPLFRSKWGKAQQGFTELLLSSFCISETVSASEELWSSRVSLVLGRTVFISLSQTFYYCFPVALWLARHILRNGWSVSPLFLSPIFGGCGKSSWVMCQLWRACNALFFSCFTLFLIHQPLDTYKMSHCTV